MRARRGATFDVMSIPTLRWARAHWVLLVGTLAVVCLIVVVGPVKAAAALDAADPRALALMLPVALLIYLLHGVAWWLGLRAAGADVSLPRAVEATYTSQALVFLPGGDLWRVPLLKRGLPTANSGVVTGAVVFDDLSYLLVLTCAMIPAVILDHSLWPYLAGLVVPQAGLITILAWRRPHDWLLARVGRLPIVRRFDDRLEMIGPAFRTIGRSRWLPAIIAMEAVCAALSVGLFGLGLAAVHARVPVVHVAFTYAGVQAAASIAVFPAALGAYESVMTGVLALQGVGPAAAAVAALLYRFFNDLVMAVVGLAVAGAADLARSLRVGTPLSWRLLRARHRPGTPRGVLRVWALVEGFTAWRLRIRPVRTGGVLRYNLSAHRGAAVRLADGSTVRPGDRLIELHLDNARLSGLAAADPAPWHLLRELRSDLRELGRLIVAGELDGAVALHGVTLLAAAGPRLGFELRPLAPTWSLRLHRFFFVGLVALHDPAGPAAIAHQRARWPAEIWMSRRQLLAGYLPEAARAA